MASALRNQVSSCVISFLDLYEKTKRNFPAAQAVTEAEQKRLVARLAEIGAKYEIPIRTCCENVSLAQYGIDVTGCMTKAVLEAATGCHFAVPKGKRSPRAQCDCLLGSDIGMYNTCPHGCVYCYANYDRRTVARNVAQHDPDSPFLIGNYRKGDQVIEVPQESFIDRQMTLF